MTHIEFRRDTALNWLTHDPVLASGEPALEIDSGQLKIGNGHLPWSKLPYVITNGDTVLTGPQAYVQSTAPINTPRGSVWIVSHANASPFPLPPSLPGTGKWAQTGVGGLTVTGA